MTYRRLTEPDISTDTRARGWEELRLALREGPDLEQAYTRMLTVLVPLVQAEGLETASDGLCCGQDLDYMAKRLREQVSDVG